MKNQKGFAVLEGLLILVIIGILAGTGYYVMNASKNTDKTLGDTTNYSVSKSTKSNATPSQKTLTITEWGIKLPLTSGIESAKYQKQSGNITAAYLSLTTLENTDCSLKNGGIGAIVRFKHDDVNPDDPDGATYISVLPSAPKVGDYYFMYQQSNGTCLGDAGPASAKVANTEFKDAVKQVLAE